MSMQQKPVEGVRNFFVDELSAVNFGDERLLSRLITIATMLAAKPRAPLNQAMGGRAEVIAAYRFFSNDKVEQNEILDSHRLALMKRLDAVRRVFAVQDTVFFDYSKHRATQGLGAIGRPSTKTDAMGLILHHSLIIDEDKVPYGIGSQQFWTRPVGKNSPRKEQKERVKDLPIEDKESHRWLSSMHEAEGWVADAAREVIHLGDRECDIFEFLLMAEEKDYSYVIRNSFSRQTIDNIRIEEVIKNLPVSSYLDIDVKGKGKTKRTAKLEIKYRAVSLAPSSRSKAARSKLVDDYKPVTVWLVSAEEIDPPSKQEKIVWRLFTNVAVNSVADALERIRWYQLRWAIEDFHKIIKSGFKVEDCRLETRQALERLITLTAVVALQIMRLTFLSRKTPTVDCSAVLTTEQWQALYVFIYKNNKLPQHIPTLEQATMWIGQLGGHLARKNDPPPGYTVLWRGWERMEDLAAMWSAFKRSSN